MNKIQKSMSAIAAIVLVVSVVLGSFAFKTKESNQLPLRWFKISGSYAPGTSVSPGNAVYIQTSVNPPVTPLTCNGASYQCISGFNTGQTHPDGSIYLLNDDETPVETSALQN